MLPVSRNQDSIMGLSISIFVDPRKSLIQGRGKIFVIRDI